MEDVEAINSAVSSNSGREVFYLRSDLQTHTLRPTSDYVREISVECTSLDGFVALHRSSQEIGSVVLKTDTEGNDLQVLTGASRLLKDKIIESIICEATFDSGDQDHTNFYENQAFRASFGYKIAGIYEQVCWNNPYRLAYFNALFVADPSFNSTRS